MKPRRENWNGKYRVVLRSAGRMVAWRAWSSKFTINKAAAIFKTNKSFNKNVVKRDLFAVREIVDTRVGARRPSGRSQFVVSAEKPDGTAVAARSNQTFRGEVSPKRSRQQALDRFNALYAQSEGLGYDEELGRTSFAEDVREEGVVEKRGWVYYVAKPRK